MGAAGRGADRRAAVVTLRSHPSRVDSCTRPPSAGGSRVHVSVSALSASPELPFFECRRRAKRGGSSGHGEDDKAQDLPSLPAKLSPNVQLRPLQNPPGQSRRADIQVFPGKSGPRLPLQRRGERGLRPRRGEGAPHRPARRRGHLL